MALLWCERGKRKDLLIFGPSFRSMSIAKRSRTVFSYSVRFNRLSRELEKLGAAAEAALSKALTKQPSVEGKRRIAELLEKLAPLSAHHLRQVRAVQVLEYAATPEAKQLLAILANGEATDRRTREARESLQRLLKRRQPE